MAGTRFPSRPFFHSFLTFPPLSLGGVACVSSLEPSACSVRHSSRISGSVVILSASAQRSNCSISSASGIHLVRKSDIQPSERTPSRHLFGLPP